MGYENAIPWAISALSLLFCILTYFRNSSKDKASSIKEEDLKMDGITKGILKVEMRVEQIAKDTSETNSELKTFRQDLKDLSSRVSRCEAFIEQMQKGS